MESGLIDALANLPWALVFVYFLHLSFQQREKTMRLMSEMVERFARMIASCCDDDDSTKVNH